MAAFASSAKKRARTEADDSTPAELSPAFLSLLARSIPMHTGMARSGLDTFSDAISALPFSVEEALRLLNPVVQAEQAAPLSDLMGAGAQRQSSSLPFFPTCARSPCPVLHVPGCWWTSCAWALRRGAWRTTSFSAIWKRRWQWSPGDPPWLCLAVPHATHCGAC